MIILSMAGGVKEHLMRVLAPVQTGVEYGGGVWVRLAR